MKKVYYKPLGVMEYGAAWALQEKLLSEDLAIKSQNAKLPETEQTLINNFLLTVTHPHVYTLGKSGALSHLLLKDKEMKELGISFFHTNRGGDITYHGPGQLVSYPILDLEQFETDLGKYMRHLEETIIKTIQVFGIKGDRLKGATGVWIEPHDPAKARKICAMGVKCSRWVTIHGLALNMNTDLSFFGHIIPCGIQDKGVASIADEIGAPVDESEVERMFIEKFEEVFDVSVRPDSELAVIQ